MLVHGEAAKMEFLKQKIMQEFGVSCHMPANGESVTITITPSIPVDMSRLLFKRTLEQTYGELTLALSQSLSHNSILILTFDLK